MTAPFNEETTRFALAKVFANGLVAFIAFVFSLFSVIEGALNVPIAGSKSLFLVGTAVYLFAAASIES